MLRALHRFTALGLVLLWLPVTLCCTIEAAFGHEFSLCAADCTDGSADSDHQDSCDLIEKGKYRSSLALIKVSSPAATTCAWLLVPTVPSPASAFESAFDPRSTERPREWVPIWQFERRAAAPAHAPDSSIA